MSSPVVTGHMRFVEKKGFDNSGRGNQAFLFSESDILRPALYSFRADWLR